jgi:hypothetical protein
MDELTLYESTQRYYALEMTPDNAEMLSTWGLDTTNQMNYHAGLWAVRQNDTGLVVAILDTDSFQSQFTAVAP